MIDNVILTALVLVKMFIIAIPNVIMLLGVLAIVTYATNDKCWLRKIANKIK